MEVVLFVVAGGALGLLALIGVTRARTVKRGYSAQPDGGTSYMWVDGSSSSGDCSSGDAGGGCDGGGGGGGD